MIIILNDEDIHVCKVFGELRSLSARSNNIKDVKVGNHNGIDGDIIGFMGEYAFAKAFNVFPDFGLKPRSGSPDGIIKGLRYDVKSTNYKNGKLLSTLKVNADVDLYVLAIIQQNIVELKGYAYKNELINEKNKKDLGHGIGYVLNQYELRHISELQDGLA